jgi:hypothetical protein
VVIVEGLGVGVDGVGVGAGDGVLEFVYKLKHARTHSNKMASAKALRLHVDAVSSIAAGPRKCCKQAQC